MYTPTNAESAAAREIQDALGFSVEHVVWNEPRHAHHHGGHIYCYGPSNPVGLYYRQFGVYSDTLRMLVSQFAGYPALASLCARLVAVQDVIPVATWDKAPERRSELYCYSRPEIQKDDDGQAHCADGPAITGPLGVVYCWHGARVTEQELFHPLDSPMSAFLGKDRKPYLLEIVGGYAGLVNHQDVRCLGTDAYGAIYEAVVQGRHYNARKYYHRFVVPGGSLTPFTTTSRSVRPKYIIGKRMKQILTQGGTDGDGLHA